MMASTTSFFALLLSVAVGGHGAEDAVSSSRVGDVRNCPTTSPIFPKEPLYRMEVLPGAGFDVLRSVDMGQVHAYNYSLCRVSNDGRYLLPDNVFLVPTLESHVQVFSELIDNWKKYTSTVSASISVSASYRSIISGKFSAEYESVKSHMYRDNSVTTRVQIRNALYKVKLQPDSELHPNFKSRLFEMAANIQSNNTEYARYLAELTVRQYGTHYVTSMDAGAVLSQVDHVKSTFLSSSESHKVAITASASANFHKKLNIGGNFSFSMAENDAQQEFFNNRTYSRVYSWGGPPFNIDMSVAEWVEGIPNAMVAIDRTGDPLYFAITPTTLPEIPEGTVYQLADLISKAISRYYRINTRRGCTDPSSPNFDFQANADDHSCSATQKDYTFGGVYQTCTAASSHNYEDLCNSGKAPITQMNPLTGGASCPDPYIPVLLRSGQYKHTIYKPECTNHCSLLIFNCRSECYKKPMTSIVNYETYWCVTADGHAKPNSGYLFGGHYTSTTSNPFSDMQACPRYFMPLHVGVDTYICVSNDYELGFQASIPFAGFMSCQAGNPLATSTPSTNNTSSWPHACPAGFTQHLLAVDIDCEINYCVKTGSFNEKPLLPPHLPPFRKRKQMNPNTTSTLAIIGNHGFIWYKNEDGQWVKDYAGTQSGKLFLEGFNSEEDDSSSSSKSLSSGSVVGISISATIVLCTIIAFLFFAGYSIKKKISKRCSRPGEDSYYLNVSESNTLRNDAV